MALAEGGRTRLFLKQAPGGEQSDRRGQDDELDGVGRGIQRADEQGDPAVHHGENLKGASQAAHQSSRSTAARMRSTPSFTFSREVA